MTADRMTQIRTVGSALTEATSRLRDAASPTARLDAEVLLAHVAARDRAWLLAHPEAEIDTDTAAAFEAALGRRAAGEPVAYIRGFKEWHSLRIRTDRRALIPRPETELLAEAAMAQIASRLGRDAAPVVAWEVATGSGAVSVAVAVRFRSTLESGRLILIASDFSAEALELAVANLEAHGVGDMVTTAFADLLGPAGGLLPRPDVIVTNLPYVASAEVDARHGSLGHEPRIALDGGLDGLELLRRIFAELPERAATGATVLLEIGVGQRAAVASLAPPGASVSVVPDLAGLDRVLRVDLGG
jgi:release factor glutamine methyltransferase